MARADLLLSLVRAASSGDQAMVRKTVEAMAAEERSKNHSVLAEQLEMQVYRNGSTPKLDYAPTHIVAHDLVHEITPRRNISELVLNPTVRSAIDELVQEHHRADLLRS